MLSEVDDKDNNAANVYKNSNVQSGRDEPNLRGVGPAHVCVKKKCSKLAVQLLAALSVRVRVSQPGSLLGPSGHDLSRGSRSSVRDSSDTVRITSGLEYLVPHMILFLASPAALNAHVTLEVMLFSPKCLLIFTLKTCERVHGFRIGLIRAAPAAHLGLFFHIVNAV